MSDPHEEIASLRAEVAALKATALTAEQRQAVDRLADHVEAIVTMVDQHRMRRLFLSTARSWIVALAALFAAAWVIRDGAARVIKALVSGD